MWRHEPDNRNTKDEEKQLKNIFRRLFLSFPQLQMFMTLVCVMLFLFLLLHHPQTNRSEHSHAQMPSSDNLFNTREEKKSERENPQNHWR